jgi:Ca-activated chloride channel family protein
MKMILGKRIIEAKIQKREEARRAYEQAIDQGKTATLLEQQRPNVFQMNVANIMPGDEIRVELKYTELLVPTDRVYEFVYPTVVGPRYSNQGAASSPSREDWVQNPYLHQGERPTYSFDLNLSLAAGLPIQDLFCPSHKVKTSFSSPSEAKVVLEPSDRQGGNRDFILRYRLAGQRVHSGLLLFEGEKENFFLLQIQPPKQVSVEQIPGREYIFIVDVSGSMYGFPLEISKKLLKDLIGNLRSQDRFNVLLFSGGSSLLSTQSLPATRENLDRAVELIARQRGGGGTELLPALKRVLDLEKTEGFARTIVIATDGYVAVEEAVFDLIRKNLGQANMFAFGIGSSVNRHIIEGMAHVGMGEAFVITDPHQAPVQAGRFRQMIESPVLTKIKTVFEGFSVYDIEPLGIPDLFAERPVAVFGKWRGKSKGKITLSGLSGEGPFQEAIEVQNVKPIETNQGLRYLWARHKITLLSDFNRLRPDDRRTQEITELGLKYNLLTAYTSFVAVDTEVRNKNGPPVTVKQPLPLPQGVSDYAVGEARKLALSAPVGSVSALSPAQGADALYYKNTARKKEEKGKHDIMALPEVQVSGNLIKEEVVKVVQTHIKELERCFQKGKQEGKIIIKLRISSDGTVKEVMVELKSVPSIKKCLREQTTNWRFPPTRDEQPGEITLTFEGLE